MVRFKIYRGFRVMMGSRSFVKRNEDGESDTFALIRGTQQAMQETAERFIEMGFIEEWAQQPEEA
jgi:hypothetical protein